MGDTGKPRQRTGLGWTVPTVVVLIVAMAFAFGILGGDSDQEPPGTTVPAAPPEKIDVSDVASLTVPDTVRTAVESFHAPDGQSYLLDFDISVTKPEGSAGAAMYLAVSLNCAGEHGSGTESSGGTQNLITGEPTTLRNQFVLVGDGGEQACNISLSAPYPDVAASGVTVEFDVRWTAEPVDGRSFELDSEERLPLSAEVGERALIFSRTVDLEEVRGLHLDVLSTVHLTACTGINGSRENGRAWCDTSTVDPEGSGVDLLLQIDLLDADGHRCDEIDGQPVAVHIDRFTHHRLVDINLDAAVPDQPCGSSLRVSLIADAQGPAPVVVHGAGSSFVVVVRESSTRVESEQG